MFTEVDAAKSRKVPMERPICRFFAATGVCKRYKSACPNRHERPGMPMLMTGDNPFQSTGSEATFKSGEKAPKFLYTADDPQSGGTHLRQQQLEEDIPRRKRIGDNPGDWACNQCEKQNFSRETECFRCKTPKGAPKTEKSPKKPKQDDPEDDEWKSIPGGRPGDW